jgi:hypothetical protein
LDYIFFIFNHIVTSLLTMLLLGYCPSCNFSERPPPRVDKTLSFDWSEWNKNAHSCVSLIFQHTEATLWIRVILYQMVHILVSKSNYICLCILGIILCTHSCNRAIVLIAIRGSSQL